MQNSKQIYQIAVLAFLSVLSSGSVVGLVAANGVAKGRRPAPVVFIGTTDARVACSFVFTRPFSN